MENLSFDDAIAQFAAWLLTALGRSRATVESYQRDLEQFAEHAGIGRLEQLDSAAVLRWVGKVKEAQLAPRSYARKLSALRSFISWALEYRYIASNPIPDELAVPQSLYLPHALSEAEVKAMLDASTVGTQLAASEPPSLNQQPADVASSVPTGKHSALAQASAIRDYAMLEVLYASGIRVSELTGLRLVDLHFGEGFAMVTGKGNKQRLVPLGQYAIDALKAYLGGPRGALCKSALQHGEVFVSRRGPISRSQVFRIIKDIAARAGITSNVSPHTFRHSCASHLLAHGADLRLVQELLGHSALSTTQVYTHIEKSRLRQVYDACHPMA
jgi:integrase/recombinase XerD